MIRTTVHAFIWVFILTLVCACGRSADSIAAEQYEARVTAGVPAAPEGLPAALPVTTMIPPRGEVIKMWSEFNVIRDPETGCEYLMSPSGDLEPRNARFDTSVAAYQTGCLPSKWRSGPAPASASARP